MAILAKGAAIKKRLILIAVYEVLKENYSHL